MIVCRQLEGDPDAMVWYDEIQETINLANSHAQEGVRRELNAQAYPYYMYIIQHVCFAHAVSVAVAAANLAVDSGENLLPALTNPDLAVTGVVAECTSTYQDELASFKARKAEAGVCGSGWMMNRLNDGFKFFFNVNTLQYAFERAYDMDKDHTLLTREEIQSCVSDVTAAHNRQLLFKANEGLIVLLQARVRGALARRRLHSRCALFHDNQQHIVKMQVRVRLDSFQVMNVSESCVCVAVVVAHGSRKEEVRRISRLRETERATRCRGESH